MDAYWMNWAIRLARQGLGYTAPNPPVGAVVVRDNKCVGQGYHFRAGTPHAEVWALDQAGARARGATLYVTLEPCCHYGRTPPCTERIIAAGIRRVVIGSLDPNPKVHGRGIQTLRTAGLTVDVGVCAQWTDRLIDGFATWVTAHRPYVILKAGITADGRIGRPEHGRIWITSPEARQWVHHLRATCDAILIGPRTALLDQPDLTPRVGLLHASKPYIRVILDPMGTIPDDHPVMRHPHWPTRVYTLASAYAPSDPPKENTVHRRILTPDARGELDLRTVLTDLADQGVHRLLVEGGSRVFSRFLQQRLVDEIWLFVAPTLFGDVNSLGLAERLSTETTGGLHWQTEEIIPIGANWLCIFRSPA